MEAKEQSTAACPLAAPGEPPPDALLGDSQQFVRLDPPLALALPVSGKYPVVDGQQQCVALEVAGSWQIRPLDESNDVTDIGPGSRWLWLD